VLLSSTACETQPIATGECRLQTDDETGVAGTSTTTSRARWSLSMVGV